VQHEEGTLWGEDLVIEMERPTKPVMPDEPIIFALTVANNGKFGGIFTLGLDQSSNSKGLAHYLGGSTSASEFSLDGDGGSVTKTLEIFRGPRGYVFEATTIGFGGTWDEEEVEAKSIEVYNYIDKDNKKWLRYEEPCPKVEWAGKLGREMRAVVDKSAKAVQLSIFNPRKQDGSLEILRSNGRLEHVFVYFREVGASEWSKALLDDLSQLDFANITNSDWQEDAYGYATIPWDVAKRLALEDDGFYEVSVESSCKALEGAPKEFNTIANDPILVAVDRVLPEMYGKPLPIREVIVPGEEVAMIFTEPIRCELPYQFDLVVTLSGLEDRFGKYTVGSAMSHVLQRLRSLTV
jgi:hypothetical protein